MNANRNGGNTMLLKTERTWLRNLCPQDVDSLYAYRNDARCSEHQRYEDTSRAYLTEYVARFGSARFLSTEEEQHYAICLPAGSMLGDVSVFYSAKDRCFTLGITIAGEYQRQGYAYEVLSAVVAQLRSRYPAEDIVALIEKENTGSLALFKKLGFVEECYAESIQSYVYVEYGEGRNG